MGVEKLAHRTDAVQCPYPNVRKIVETTLPVFAFNLDEDEEYSTDIAGQKAMLPENFDNKFNAGNEQQTISDYDAEGYLTVREQFEGGRLILRERLIYNDAKAIERTLTEDLLNENIQKEERYYDSKGRILRCVITFSDSSQTIVDHVWRADGLEEEEITRSEEGIESHFLRKYDEAGHVIEETQIDHETGKKVTRHIAYDTEGRPVEFSSFVNGAKLATLSVVYDIDGRDIERKAYTSSGKLSNASYSTYEDGLLISKRTVSRKGEELQTFFYDEKRRPSQLFIQIPGGISQRLYEYDDLGRLRVSAVRRLSSSRPSAVQASTSWYEYET